MQNFKSIPNSIVSYYLGIDFLDSVPSDYVEYLNPSRHRYRLDEGRVDIAYASDSVSFDIQDLIFQYEVPAYGGLERSFVDGELDVLIEMSGDEDDVSEGRYDRLSFSGFIDLEADALGEVIDLQEDFSSGSLDVDVIGAFRFDRGDEIFKVDRVDVTLRESGTAWEARVFPEARRQGGVLAKIFEDGDLLGRVVKDGRGRYGVEVNRDLMSRFSITDQSVNALLASQNIVYRDLDPEDLRVSLGGSENGLDMDPYLEFSLNQEFGVYSVERYLEDWTGLNRVDLRFLPSNRLDNATHGLRLNRSYQSVFDLSYEDALVRGRLVEPVLINTEESHDVLLGTSSRDHLIGSNDGEIIAGGGGRDRLVGGRGADGFLMDVVRRFGRRKMTKIDDFDAQEGDKLLLSSALLTDVDDLNLALVSGNREARSAALTESNLVYDLGKGRLYFNQNGDEEGWGEGGLFLKLKGAPQLDLEHLSLQRQAVSEQLPEPYLMEPEDYDFDEDGSVSLQTDAVIGVRKMLGTFPGDALFEGLGPVADAEGRTQIDETLNQLVTQNALDLDRDGTVSTLTDVLMLIMNIQDLS